MRFGGHRASRFHLIFLTVVGLVGWSLVAWSFVGPAGSRLPSAWPSLEAAALFVAVVAAARALAFPLAGLGGNAEVSLDSAIYIAATACLGARATALGVGVLLSADMLVRGLRTPESAPCQRRSSGAADATCLCAHTLYFGGLSGGLLAFWARVFGVYGNELKTDDVWLVPVLGIAFLLSHYMIQTVQLRLSGQPWRASIRRSAIGVLAEATLLPLASAIVAIWDPDRLIPFAQLGGTYLLVNFGFNRLAKMAATLRRRVVELETLNRTGHALGTSLETPQVLASLLRETSRALSGASRIEVVVTRAATEAATGAPEIERFVHQPGLGERREAADDHARRLLKLKQPVLEDDVRDAERPDVRSRISVPLTMYGETIGSLAAEGPHNDAFGTDELRLLDAIGGQAAAAVQNARLYALANVDGLTGLCCRRYFDVRLAEEIERARRFRNSFALVMLDLDDFKQLNDTHGHLAGDRALREIAQVAAGQLRGVDLAARYGGEELAFVLPRTSLADAHAAAERIREAIEAHVMIERGRALHVTASLGVAGWAESGADDPSTLVARADTALYRAKAAGKNRVEIDLANFELTPSLAPVVSRRAATPAPQSK